MLKSHCREIDWKGNIWKDGERSTMVLFDGQFLSGFWEVCRQACGFVAIKFKRVTKMSSTQRFNSHIDDSYVAFDGGILVLISLRSLFSTDEKYTLKISATSQGQDAEWIEAGSEPLTFVETFSGTLESLVFNLKSDQNLLVLLGRSSLRVSKKRALLSEIECFTLLRSSLNFFSVHQSERISSFVVQFLFSE